MPNPCDMPSRVLRRERRLDCGQGRRDDGRQEAVWSFGDPGGAGWPKNEVSGRTRITGAGRGKARSGPCEAALRRRPGAFAPTVSDDPRPCHEALSAH